MSRKALGDWGEDQAARHLEALGYLIRARKYRVLEGEVDLVAQDGDSLVFVEVKTRGRLTFGAPEESITAKKRRRLQIAAWAYLDEHNQLDRDWRIDVIAIEGTPAGGVSRLDHYRNAVEGEPFL